MDNINVYWVSYHKDILAHGYWDNGILDDLFKGGNFTHYEVIDEPFPEVKDGEGGIFIINGRTHVEDIDLINRDIRNLAWVLFIETGDEESSFPWRGVHHKLMKVWIMLPRMNMHDDVSFKLPNGYRPNTHELLKQIGIQERTIEYSFVGQLNHERRHQCYDVAKQFETVYTSAKVVGTDGFGKEVVPYPEYLEIMAKSKIVLCPSGVESPDNFRLYEALEAGALPIVDAFSTNFKTAGFWQYLFGTDIPFPIVNYWDELPDMLPQLLKEYPANANRCFEWWQQKKREIKYKLYDDVKELSK